MKIKWKCIFYNLILPIIVAIILCIIVMVWVNYEISKPIDPAVLNASMQQVHYVSPGSYSMIPLTQFIILPILLALLICCIRGMLKPCIIIDNNSVWDDIVRGISVIGELFSLAICIGFGLMGIICVIMDIILIKSVMDGNIITYGPDPTIMTIISCICFGISYGIYWFNQQSKI
jgi:hypothetical protein